MYKTLFAVLTGFLVVSGTTAAMEPDSRKVTTANRAMMGFSTVSLHDDYLSAEPYDGLGLQLNYSTARYPSSRSTNFFFQQDMGFLAASTQNRAGTASITQTGLQYAWGMLFPLKPLYGFKTAVGPMLGADFGVRINSRNENNPINVDLMGELLLAGNVTYDLPVRSRDIRLKASLRTPVLGCQFAPVRGISYYEMFSFGEFDDAFHLTSFHNKNAWSGEYTVDIPFHSLVLSLGMMHSYSLFKTNDMLFKQNNWSFQMGCTFDVLVFSGMSRPNPSSYLSLDR